MKASAFKPLCLSLSLFAFGAVANDAKTQAPLDPKMEAMMKAFEAYSTPGAPHKVLADLAGEWNYSSKFWEGAKAKVQESKGVSTFKMILAGRWLQQDFKGEAMGMPFEGIGLTGYDNLKGKYESLWIDNMGTGMMHGNGGTYNAAKKTISETGSSSCPMTPTKTRDYRSEWKLTSKNKMTFTMYGPDLESGKEFKQMEIQYTRK